MYSVERFYETPLVYDVSCDGKDISFKTNNIFKQASVYEGSYVIADNKGKTLADGTFDFGIHWRTTDHTVRLDEESAEGTVQIINQYGGNTTTTYKCK